MHDPANSATRIGCVEHSRDAWGWNWLDDAAQDLRLGVRALVRAPAFAITAVLILTFGIGLNLTLFQMANVGSSAAAGHQVAGDAGALQPAVAGDRISGRSLFAGAAGRARQHRAVGGAARGHQRRCVGQRAVACHVASSRPTGFRSSAVRRAQGRLVRRGSRQRHVRAGRRDQSPLLAHQARLRSDRRRQHGGCQPHSGDAGRHHAARVRRAPISISRPCGSRSTSASTCSPTARSFAHGSRKTRRCTGD